MEWLSAALLALISVAGLLARRWLQTSEALTKLQMDAMLKEQAVDFADRLVIGVESWAKGLVKRSQEKPSSEEKLGRAVVALTDRFPALSANEAELIVEYSVATAVHGEEVVLDYDDYEDDDYHEEEEEFEDESHEEAAESDEETVGGTTSA